MFVTWFKLSPREWNKSSLISVRVRVIMVMNSKGVFTPAEADECFRLVLKARKCGAWDALMKRVQDVEDISLDLKWEGSPSGTMTDACKRLREEKKSTGPEMASYVASSVGATMPIPMPVSPEQAQSPYPQGNLPPGVTSISQWGSSLVAFGKYKGVKTYEEMRDPNDPDLASYRSYCVSHYKTGSPGLKDLVDYLNACGQSMSSGSMLPGSSIPRQFRK